MRKFKFIETLVVIISLFFITANALAENSQRNENFTQTVKILTIGNSFSNNACQYLKQITESVEGCNIVIGKANMNGCSLEQHAGLIKKCEKDTSFKPYNGKSLKELLVEDNWDVVTIQQVSHLSFKAESFQPFADEICEFIKKYAPQAKVYIHETWAYAPDCSRLEDFGITANQMYRKLRTNYKVLSRRYNVPILTSGDAFFRTYKKDNGIDLWHDKDRFHANENGCYLAGCLWFAKLFNRSPQEVQFVPKGISINTAKFLQANAAQ